MYYGIDCSDERCLFADFIEERDNVLLMRNSHIDSGEVHGLDPMDSVCEIIRMNEKRNIAIIEPDGAERCIMHCR